MRVAVGTRATSPHAGSTGARGICSTDAYAELHCLSNFSFLRGASHPEELVTRAAELGYDALAITDRNSLAGVVRAHQAAREVGLHLLIGAEIILVDGPPLVLLAPDRGAYGRLARLITRGRMRSPKGECALYLGDVAELTTGAGLIAIVLPTDAAWSAQRSALCDLYAACRDIFGPDVYLAAELTYDQPDEVRLAQLDELSQRVALPLVASGAVHYHVPQRRYLQDVLTCIREKCTVATAGRRLFANAERHLRPREELVRRYAEYPELLRRTVAIARRCTFSLDELRYEYPHELVPAGLTAHEHLTQLTWAGARERYPAGVPERVRHLVENELALIAELRYEHYFLTVWDLVRFARQRGILCQGRGSAANSAVCYCLGVTAVDPARIDVLFERFISRERNEPPDIDIDFEHERREEVFQYIYTKYGRERAGLTAEVITYRPRSAVRDVGKALGLSLDRVDALARALDWWDADAVPEEALRAAGFDPRDRTIRMIVRLVQQLLRFPRHLSQHVGGFVITETPLCEIVPLENGAMPDRTFIEWDKDDIDALGILKVDCLALGMLTAIGKCFRMLQHGFKDSGIEGLRDPRAHQASILRAADGRRADISGVESLAEGDRPCEGRLHDNTQLPRHRAVWSDEPDAAGGGVDSEQYRGRPCAGQSQGLPPDADIGARLARGTGNATGDRWRTGLLGGSGPAGAGATGRGVTHVADPDRRASLPGERRGAELIARRSDPLSLSPLIPQSLHEIPPEDPRVYDLICAADTVGVFQIESRAQMSMLPRLRPRCFYDLVIEVAIVRPGPIQGGMVHPYLRRRHGIEPITYPSEAVRSVLGKTLGVPLFQEQVMRLAVVAAGFTPGEADQLRRSMAAWGRGGRIEKFQVRLLRGLLANGYTPAFAEQIYKQIRGFGEYGFPESHAASFALLVYVSAWLKCYHPAAFYAALLNSQPMGFYAPAQLVRDALRHGVPVLPVDVNWSGYDCRLEMDAASAQPAVRLGLRLVRGLSQERVRGIEAAQREGPIRSIARLARRPDVTRDTLARLAAADAFRSLGLDRRSAFWQVLALGHEPAPLFSEREPCEPAVELPHMPLDETVVQDYDSLGLSLSAHPLELVREQLNVLRVHPNSGLRGARNRQRISVAGLVTHRQRPATAGGVVFMTLEDETGTANLIVRPAVWERDKHVGRAKLALIADGFVERQGEVVHVMVSRLRDLGEQLGDLRYRSRDFR